MIRLLCYGVGLYAGCDPQGSDSHPRKAVVGFQIDGNSGTSSRFVLYRMTLALKHSTPDYGPSTLCWSRHSVIEINQDSCRIITSARQIRHVLKNEFLVDIVEGSANQSCFSVEFIKCKLTDDIYTPEIKVQSAYQPLASHFASSGFGTDPRALRTKHFVDAAAASASAIS